MQDGTVKIRLMLFKQVAGMRNGGVSPKGADKRFRKEEARYAIGWYRAITSDMFAS